MIGITGDQSKVPWISTTTMSNRSRGGLKLLSTILLGLADSRTVATLCGSAPKWNLTKRVGPQLLSLTVYSIEILRKSLKSLRSLPVPSTTLHKGSSAIRIGKPVSF